MDKIIDIQMQCAKDTIDWFGPEFLQDLGYLGLCIGGETGELQGELKKAIRDRKDLNDQEMRLRIGEELTDLFIYVCCMATALDIDLGKSYDRTRAINVGRFAAEGLTVVGEPDGGLPDGDEGTS